MTNLSRKARINRDDDAETEDRALEIERDIRNAGSQDEFDDAVDRAGRFLETVTDWMTWLDPISQAVTAVALRLGFDVPERMMSPWFRGHKALPALRPLDPIGRDDTAALEYARQLHQQLTDMQSRARMGLPPISLRSLMDESRLEELDELAELFADAIQDGNAAETVQRYGREAERILDDWAAYPASKRAGPLSTKRAPGAHAVYR